MTSDLHRRRMDVVGFGHEILYQKMVLYLNTYFEINHKWSFLFGHSYALGKLAQVVMQAVSNLGRFIHIKCFGWHSETTHHRPKGSKIRQ